jgi:hypothetical protein
MMRILECDSVKNFGAFPACSDSDPKFRAMKEVIHNAATEKLG